MREQRITIQLAGTRVACERFCDGLKKGLRAAVGHVGKLKKVIGECYSEYLLRPEEQKGANPPDAGLGMIFRYPGDPKKLRDRAKMRLWAEYLRDNGRNVTLIRQPTFHKLIRVGLPNRLRGEIWELTSGSIYLRLENPTLYADTLAKHSGKESLAIDEIEKDLNRSLPEYPGFQSEEGIGRLRRVLTAYSWVNADVGYCQAMNIVVAALLIYMSEAQAFFLLSTLCDRLVPGYYSTTMYGTLLDQKVFESLVERTMPILWEHLVKYDVQLSVVSLPWFLSLYINSMPLVFAFRVLDVFFVEGPKVLFQVGLAILRINGEELLDATDDGAFISVLKNYFVRLDESAHPKSENPKLRAVTRFQELMVVAFKEFSGITHSTITELRLKNKDAVLNNIESFAKRTAIRNLGPESKLLSTDELGAVYDRFYGVLYERQQRDLLIKQEEVRRARSNRISRIGQAVDEGNVEKGRVGLGPSTSLMDYDAFREFLAGIAKWAVSDSPTQSRRETVSNSGGGFYNSFRKNELSMSPWGNGPEPADHEFLRRLFRKWDFDSSSALTLQNVVTGLARIKGKRDIMGTINYFFELHDDDGDGKVDREGILRMSEALLFLSRRGLEGALDRATAPNGMMTEGMVTPGADVPDQSINERFLGSVSAFIRRCFEYADPDHPNNQNSQQPAQQQQAASHQEDNLIAIDDDDDDAAAGLADPDAFAIGDDDDDFDDDEENDHDLLAMDSPTVSPKLAAMRPKDTATTTSSSSLQPQPSSLHLDPSSSSTASSSISNNNNGNNGNNGNNDEEDHRRRVSRQQSEKANIALDPNNPLHITLPTFRMVVLADELLEQFFESSFPCSFHLVEGINMSSSSSGSSNTAGSASGYGGGVGGALGSAFSNVGFFGGAAAAGGSSQQGGGAGAGRGLRGVLDNIVTDGMRVAAEVRRRMEEAQRELEKNAMQAGGSGSGSGSSGQQRRAGGGGDDEDDDEDDGGPVEGLSLGGGNSSGAGGGGAGSGSGSAAPSIMEGRTRGGVRSSDRDLLTGADAEASDPTAEGSQLQQGGVVGGSGPSAGGNGAGGVTMGKVVGVEFDG